MEQANSPNQPKDVLPDVVETKTIDAATVQTKPVDYQTGGNKNFTTGYFRGGALAATHFTPTLTLKNITIYISDGTTPNGNLPGMAGDVCFGADSGKAYKCTSTTTWVSFT